MKVKIQVLKKFIASEKRENELLLKIDETQFKFIPEILNTRAEAAHITKRNTHLPTC